MPGRDLSRAASIWRLGAVVSDAIHDAARTLGADAVTAEVASRLRDAGIRMILLKGPALAAWLYADGTARVYGDVDLLVDTGKVARAERELRAMGFRPGQPGWRGVSRAWERATDAGCVDLHTSLFGAEAEPEQVWRALSATTGSLRVAGVEVETLTRPALMVHVALHAAQHGAEGGKPLRDLERALAIASEREWSDAARLAGRLDAAPAFALGLRLHPRGARLAGRLGLPDERPVAAALHARGARPLVLGLEQLATTPRLRSKLGFLARKLVPRAAYMRGQSALARRGRVGLALAYLWRPCWALLHLPGALREWRRARGEQAAARSAR